MSPEHKRLFDEAKALNASRFTELHRLIAECDRLTESALAIVESWNK